MRGIDPGTRFPNQHWYNMITGHEVNKLETSNNHQVRNPVFEISYVTGTPVRMPRLWCPKPKPLLGYGGVTKCVNLITGLQEACGQGRIGKGRLTKSQKEQRVSELDVPYMPEENAGTLDSHGSLDHTPTHYVPKYAPNCIEARRPYRPPERAEVQHVVGGRAPGPGPAPAPPHPGPFSHAPTNPRAGHGSHGTGLVMNPFLGMLVPSIMGNWEPRRENESLDHYRNRLKLFQKAWNEEKRRISRPRL